MTATLLDDATQARVVAAYLKRHPEFLSEYPELAAKLTMPPREQGGAVASLAVYQMQSLRDKNADLERRLAELIEIPAQNEKLMERVQALTVALLRASTMQVTVRACRDVARPTRCCPCSLQDRTTYCTVTRRSSTG